MVKYTKGSETKKNKNMGFFKWLDNLIGKMNWIDIKTVGFIGLFIAFILIKLFPGILDMVLNTNIWIFVFITLLLYFRLYYVFFFKKG